MPNFRIRDAMKIVGLPPEPIEPASNEEIYRAGLVRLRNAAVAALAAPEDLSRKDHVSRSAKAAIVQLGLRAEADVAELRRLLKTSRTTIYRLLDAEIPGAAINAARTRLALEDFVTTVRMRQGREYVRRKSNR